MIRVAGTIDRVRYLRPEIEEPAFDLAIGARVIDIAEMEQHSITLSVVLNARRADRRAIQPRTPIAQYGNPQRIRELIRSRQRSLPLVRPQLFYPGQETARPTQHVMFIKLSFKFATSFSFDLSYACSALGDETLQKGCKPVVGRHENSRHFLLFFK